MIFLLFALGASAGSFLDVVASRYKPGSFLLSRKSIGGRSHCAKCKKTLSWFELAPVLSFLLQRGRCRSCGARLSVRYPLVEIVSGMLFVFAPLRLGAPSLPVFSLYHLLFIAFWILVFLSLLLLSLIDLRLGLIPDELNVFLAFLGLLIAAFSSSAPAFPVESFLGSFALIFGWGGNVWFNRFAAAVFAGGAFGFLIYITRGRGMGWGDFKLAIPLGFVFGWPDILAVVGAAFVSGAVFGLAAIALRRKTLKSALPFGPFLAAAAAFVFFFGKPLADLYLKTFYL